MTMAKKPSIKTKYAQLKWNVTKLVGRYIKYIVVHYTGTTATAENNCRYFSTGDRRSSADFFIGKTGLIWQFNKDLKNWYSWHCGDGYGAYGITNANSIGIEVVSAGKVFTAAQQAALNELVTWLMDQHDVPASRVVRHYDASRKLCPAPYCGTKAKNDRWAKLRQTITGKAEKVEKVNSKVNAKTANAATNYTKSLAGTYRCTDDLNLRVGAGVRQKLKVEMPYNTKVQCYGYWTPSGTTKWLLVSVKVDGVEYVGYCSKNFLKKVV